MTLKQTSFLESTPTVAHYAAPVRHTDPQTSHDAAAKVNTPKSWRTVATILEQLGAASSYEVAVYAKQHKLAISESRIRGSLSPSEMLGSGFIAVVRVEAASEFGNDANVYRLTESGKQLAREE